MAPPALDLALGLDLRGVSPGTPVRAHLVASLRALGEGVERARPPLSVVFVVDVSGSMAGPPLEQVAGSIDRLVGLLEPTDRVGIAAFSDGASEVVALALLDAEARRRISTRVHRLKAEGGTNMEEGLLRGKAMMPPRGKHERQLLVMLGDGAPNRGKVTPEDLSALARSFRPDVVVSTLGYGAHHHEDVLAQIADAGAGRYHFIADPSVCSIELAQAIGVQGDAVAEAVELSLAPAEGVEIRRFYGNPEVRFGAGGVRVGVPDLLDGGRAVVVAELSLTPPREAGMWEALGATASYRRAGEVEALSLAAVLKVPVGMAVTGPEPVARAEVLIAQADEARAEARRQADRGQFEGAAAVLRQMIRVIEEEPGRARGDGSALDEALEQLVDEAVAMERKPSQEAYQVFRKAQVQSRSLVDASEMHASSPMSVRMVESVAGALPRASLVVVAGDDAGRRYALDQPRITIGRTKAAQVRIVDANVSRMQTLIVGQEGKFIASDLGSTNTTCLNGERLTRPAPLGPGDVLRVGDVELRYEEEGGGART
ncbi:VWA domain-containing protein [Chondromyces apiculatus]|uniref:VWA domain-containing protein n=1 Tax=Chondromyces apiculatus DSM 436 TaxID=1192034 RepID=A0A017SXD1_9BACT|nr:VWA domain-containing protein [Chondromyces apiculatus]EYF00966.1 Hypothetical protein CAP_8834 [Chondromyces apiculatus DSM 436]